MRRLRSLDWLEDHLPDPVARLVRWARSDESLSTAASLAFFALVSLAPMALIAFWLAGAVAGEDAIRDLGGRLAGLMPEEVEAGEMLVDIVAVATTLGWTSIVAVLWPATAYGAGLARAFDRLTPTGRRPMDAWRGRLLVVVLIALLPLLILGALLALLIVPALLGEGLLVRLAGLALGGLIALGALTGALALLYYLFSPAAVDVRAALGGGAWAAGMVTVLSVGFALYLRLGGDVAETYGSRAFAAVVLLGLWLYLANGALVVGYKTALVRADVPAWHDAEER